MTIGFDDYEASIIYFRRIVQAVYAPPAPDPRRIARRFLWLPVCLTDAETGRRQWRWLTTAAMVEERRTDMQGHSVATAARGYYREPICWIEKGN